MKFIPPLLRGYFFYYGCEVGAVSFLTVAAMARSSAALNFLRSMLSGKNSRSDCATFPCGSAKISKIRRIEACCSANASRTLGKAALSFGLFGTGGRARHCSTASRRLSTSAFASRPSTWASSDIFFHGSDKAAFSAGKLRQSDATTVSIRGSLLLILFALQNDYIRQHL